MISEIFRPRIAECEKIHKQKIKNEIDILKNVKNTQYDPHGDNDDVSHGMGTGGSLADKPIKPKDKHKNKKRRMKKDQQSDDREDVEDI